MSEDTPAGWEWDLDIVGDHYDRTDYPGPIEGHVTPQDRMAAGVEQRTWLARITRGRKVLAHQGGFITAEAAMLWADARAEELPSETNKEAAL